MVDVFISYASEDSDRVAPMIATAIGDEGSMDRWLKAVRDNRISWYPWLISWLPTTQSHSNQPMMQTLLVELDPDAMSTKFSGSGEPLHQ